jgi:hypothetical protein
MGWHGSFCFFELGMFIVLVAFLMATASYYMERARYVLYGKRGEEFDEEGWHDWPVHRWEQ